MNTLKLKSIVTRFQKVFILFAVMAVLTVMQPGVFLTIGNFKSILLAISVYGVMVCGTIYPILLGGIDLAVGATAAMSGACAVLTIVNHNYSVQGVVLGILLGLAAGTAAGAVHGIVVSQFKVPPFLITLASQNIVYGIAQLLTGNQVVSCLKPAAFHSPSRRYPSSYTQKLALLQRATASGRWPFIPL